MKTRKLGELIFFAVTLIVFGCGTVFTAMHRWDVKASIVARQNILSIAGALFLTVAELALVYLHSLIGSKELWRRITAFCFAIALSLTITYATYTEASSYMEEGNISTKAKVISEFTETQKSSAKTKSERRQAMAQGNENLNKMLSDAVAPDFAPFAVNFFFGLFSILVCTLIQPREAWKRKSGNIMSDDVRKQWEREYSYPLPQNAVAYMDGKGSSIIVKVGRQYLGSLSNRIEKL